MSAWWSKMDWRLKGLIFFCALDVLVIGATKTGLWEPSASQPLPPFDTQKCRQEILDAYYRGLPLDELSDDIQLGIRHECSMARIDYQGY